MKGQSLYIPYSGKAPKYVTRRHPLLDFNTVAYKTDGDPTDPPKDPPKPDKRSAEDLLADIQKRFDKSLEGFATAAELAKIRAEQTAAMAGVPIEQLRELLDQKDGILAIIARQGLEMQRLSTKLETATRGNEDMSIRGQIARWAEVNKNAIGNAVSRKRSGADLTPMSLRVDSPMFVSTVNSTASPFIGKTSYESGINDFIRIQPLFWDFIKKGRINAPTHVWVNKTSPLGAADFIGPGVAKPGVSFKLIAETSTAKKVAASAKAGTEVLKDIDGMTSFIEEEIRYQVLIAANTAAMTGVASSTDINGIQTLSVAFPAVGTSGLFTTNPNYMDAIRAVVAYMRSGLLTGPLTIFINSIDAGNMDMSKATDSGVYMLPPFVTADGRTIAGARIVEDYNIPVGSLQAAFLQYYKIWIYEDLFVEWGWENDDFTKNLVTAIGEMRFHQMFNSIYTGAFLFDTFENIKTSITAP